MSPGAHLALASIRALVFDVFGTVVDWRTSIVDELSLRAHRKLLASSDPGDQHGLSPDPSDLVSRFAATAADPETWSRFAQAWHDSYMAFTASFDPSRDAWKSVDRHHRNSLVALLHDWGFEGLCYDAEMDSLSLVWHRLNPWPDSSEGLRALGSSGKIVTATLSNGNVVLLRDLDDFGSLGFDKLLSAEMFGAYKPNPATYLGAAAKLGLEPSQVAMVAAHLGDLKAARACGLRTIYVERPREEAWDKDSDEYRQAREWVDLWIPEQEDDLLSLARRLQELLDA